MIQDWEPILERSRSGDARQRYDAAVALAKHPAEPVARRLVELISDYDGGILDPDTAHLVDDPTEFRVATAALQSLEAMPVVALPIVLERLPHASSSDAPVMVLVFGHYPADELAALPDDTLALMVTWTEKLLGTRAITNMRWERELARRLRAGELDPEQFWTVRLESHPSSVARADAIRKLVLVASDKAAFAERMVTLLGSNLVGAAARALADLPPVLGVRAETVPALAAAIERYGSHGIVLLPALARYGEPAATLAPFCLEILRQRFQEGYGEYRQKAAATALLLLGSAADRVRAALIDLMFEPHYDRSQTQVLRALGDPRRLADDVLPRILTALRGDDAGERQAACRLLGGIAPHGAHLLCEVVPHLDPAGPLEVVTAAAIAVPRMGGDGRPAVPALVRLLEVESLRYYGARALHDLGPAATEAVPAMRALIERLRGTRSPISEIEYALAAIEGC